MIATENLTMTKNQTIKVGDYVLVALPHESQFLEIKVENLRPFDRQQMRVSKRVSPKRSSQCYYELEGAVSDGYEIPFGFMQDWLIKL